ncbi:MAG: four helix bundle protein [Candidatus Tenebribacter burtonii]|jgi:four helix bundle protein|nr:four helix bundle protein [Candidatus Tenebribacter burtonii]
MKNYKELIVWQKGIELAIEIYRIIDLFPSKEKYTLTNQMQRTVISISSNIAEGWGRGLTKEYIYFSTCCKRFFIGIRNTSYHCFQT